MARGECHEQVWHFPSGYFALQNKNKDAFPSWRSIIFQLNRYNLNTEERWSLCLVHRSQFLTKTGFSRMKKLYQQTMMRGSKTSVSPNRETSHWLSRGSAVIAVVAGVTLLAAPASARWYKWVDENGNISYQDRPPPSTFEESTQVLSQHGVTLETIPSKLEQIELDRLALLEKEKKQRDVALMRAFPNESDLIATRNKRVLHIDGAIARMHDQMVILNTRLINIEDRIAERIDRQLALSDALESDRIAVIRSIDSNDALITSKLRERRLVVAQFDRDLRRYRELKQLAATANFSD